MKNQLYSTIFIFLILFSCVNSKKIVSNKENLALFKDSKNELIKLYNSKITIKYISISDSIIKTDQRLIATKLLFDRHLIAEKGNIIIINKSGSMLFTLSNKGKYIVYDNCNDYMDRCNFNQIKFLLEKDWYFLLACDD